MSAFQCSAAHISAIVRAWIHLPQHRAFSWPISEDLARAADERHPWEYHFRRDHAGRPVAEASRSPHWDVVAEDLARENARSVNLRYPEGKVNPVPVHVSGGMVPRMAAVKLCDCLEYQSCEHGGWEASPARRGLDMLREALIRMDPAYQDAPWAIEAEEDLFRKRTG